MSTPNPFLHVRSNDLTSLSGMTGATHAADAAMARAADDYDRSGDLPLDMFRQLGELVCRAGDVSTWMGIHRDRGPARRQMRDTLIGVAAQALRMAEKLDRNHLGR